MPAPVSWPGTPTVSSLWASFPGGIGAPNVPIPLNGGARRKSRSRKHMRKSRSKSRSKSRKSRSKSRKSHK